MGTNIFLKRLIYISLPILLLVLVTLLIARYKNPHKLFSRFLAAPATRRPTAIPTVGVPTATPTSSVFPPFVVISDSQYNFSLFLSNSGSWHIKSLEKKVLPNQTIYTFPDEPTKITVGKFTNEQGKPINYLQYYSQKRREIVNQAYQGGFSEKQVVVDGQPGKLIIYEEDDSASDCELFFPLPKSTSYVHIFDYYNCVQYADLIKFSDIYEHVQYSTAQVYDTLKVKGVIDKDWLSSDSSGPVIEVFDQANNLLSQQVAAIVPPDDWQLAPNQSRFTVELSLNGLPLRKLSSVYVRISLPNNQYLTSKQEVFAVPPPTPTPTPAYKQ